MLCLYLKPLDSFGIHDRLALILDLILLLADLPQALLCKLHDELVLVWCHVWAAL
jgi:hypothetical protein